MIRSPWRDKLRAAGIHLAICVVIGAAILTLFLAVWYPRPLFGAMGSGRLLATILAVDLVLGPLLTFIVFRRGKPSLRFDLACIGVAQLLALGYGLHVAYMARPVYIAVLLSRGTVVRAGDVVLEPAPAPAFARTPTWGLRYAAVLPPTDPAQRQDMLFRALEGQPDIDVRPGYYSELGEALPEIAAQAQPLLAADAKRPGAARHYRSWAQARNLKVEDLRYLPLMTPGDELRLVIDPRGPRIAGIATLPD